jgi:hypothetical protein
MSRSTCQKASIKLSVDGAEDMIVPSTLVNFSHPSIDSFQKHIMTLCRPTLKDPLYDYESITLFDKEVDLACLKSTLAGILKEIVAGKKPTLPKFIVSIHICIVHSIPISVLTRQRHQFYQVVGKSAGRNKTGLPRRAPIPSFRSSSSLQKTQTTPRTLLRAASANNLIDSVDEDDGDENPDGETCVAYQSHMLLTTH